MTNPLIGYLRRDCECLITGFDHITLTKLGKYDRTTNKVLNDILNNVSIQIVILITKKKQLLQQEFGMTDNSTLLVFLNTSTNFATTIYLI